MFGEFKSWLEISDARWSAHSSHSSFHKFFFCRFIPANGLKPLKWGKWTETFNKVEKMLLQIHLFILLLFLLAIFLCKQFKQFITASIGYKNGIRDACSSEDIFIHKFQTLFGMFVWAIFLGTLFDTCDLSDVVSLKCTNIRWVCNQLYLALSWSALVCW